MRLRRKARSSAPAEEDRGAEATPEVEEPRTGPFDAGDLPEDEVKRVDLGGLVVAPSKGKDLRVQVDQKSGKVRAVLLAGESGALELRAYAAPRNGDLWEEVRPQIAADATKKGGTASERQGRFGTELLCELKVRTSDGRTGTQISRVIGINGPRWLLRATLLGDPAKEPDNAQDWEDAITQVAVRRGDHAMPAGEQLPLTLPEGMQSADAPQG